MGRKSKFTIEKKVEAVLDYKSGKRGARQICNDLGIHQSCKGLHKSHTEEELILAIDKYIDFFNNERLQGRHHNLTTNEVREAALTTDSKILPSIRNETSKSR